MVSNHGRLRTIHGAPLLPWLNDQGYYVARLSAPRRMVRVHRLVGEAFVANPDRKPNINHRDSNRANNHASNLEWCTQAENIAHADQAGRMQRNHWKGKRSPNAMLTADQVRAIRKLYASGHWSMAALAAQVDVSKRCIGRIVNGETYADV